MKHFLHFLLSFMVINTFNTRAQLVLPEGMEMLTPEGVTVTVEDARAVDKAKNMVVAGTPDKGYKVYFTAQDATSGEELWVSDGTKAGTKMVKDIFPGETSSGVAWMQRFNDKVVFQAQGDVDTGVELWISDGTAEGTKMIKDIHFFGSSNPSGFTQLNETQFVFCAQDFDSETFGSTPQKWLWISDGTEEGTKLLKDCDVRHPGMNKASDNELHFCRMGRKVFFKADSKDQMYGEELWITDGTTEGTIMLKDINKQVVDEVTGATAGSSIDWLTNFYNEKIFFKAYSADSTGGNEPWMSDGTPEGTKQIADLFPGVNANGIPNGYGAFTPRVYKDKVIFRGYAGSAFGEELVATDFTPEGTKMIKDLRTTPTDAGTMSSWPDIFVEFDGVLFMKANSGVDANITGELGLELFYTDGTPEGTKMQSDMNPGVGHNAAWEGIVIGGSFYFRAQNAPPVGAQSWELFKLDHKDDSAVKVVDLVEGQDFVHSLRNLNGTVVFTSKSVKSLFKYYYRKSNYDSIKDKDILEPEYRTRAEITPIKEITAKSVKNLNIFPNPSSEVFSFDLNDKVISLRIFDVSGKKIKEISNPTMHTISVSSFEKGAYLVVVSTENGIYKTMLIVK